MEKRTRQIWLRNTQPNGRTPFRLHPPARRILRSIQPGPTQSGSKNKIINLLPRVSPADHKLNLPVRPPLPPLAPVKFFRIRVHPRLKKFVLIRVPRFAPANSNKLGHPFGGGLGKPIRVKAPLLGPDFAIRPYSTLFGGVPYVPSSDYKKLPNEPISEIFICLQTKGILNKVSQTSTKNEPIFWMKTHSQPK